MTLKAILTLNYEKMNPATGDVYTMLGGRIDGNDTDYLAETAFGWIIIPKGEVADVLLIHEDLAIDTETLPYVWWVNDVNAAQ